MLKVLDWPLRPLRFVIALAAVLSLAGPSALASSTAECKDAWDDSSASDTCRNPSIEFGDWNNCLQCCSIFADCHTGQMFGPNQYKTTGIGVPLSDVDDLENCQGTLTNGSC